MAQYFTLDGSLMDIKSFNMISASMKGVNSNQIYLFNKSQGVLFNVTTTFVCQGLCNCGPGYIQQGS